MKLDRRLLSLLGSQRFLLVLAILAGFMGGVLIAFQARILSRIVNLVYLAQSELPDVSELLFVLLALIIIRGALIWGGDFAASRLAVRIKTALRIRLFKHLMWLGPGYLKQASDNEGVRTGELVNVVNEGVETLHAYFSQYLPQLALAVLVPLTILAVILPVDTLSGLVLLFTAPLIPIFMILIGDLANTLTRRQWSTLSRMSAHFLDVLQGLTTLKIFGRSNAQIRVIAQIGDRYRSTTMDVLRVTFLSALVLEWVAMLSTAVVAVEIGLRLLYGRLSFEEAFFVLLLTPEFYLPLRMLGTRFHAGMAGVAAADRIFEILAIQPTIPQPVEEFQAPLGDRSPHLAEQLSITFEDVHFAFSGGQDVLRGITFSIPAGEMVALVGPSGGGKSTIADLLLGFIQPQHGQILINGQPKGSIQKYDWTSKVSWVSQDPYLFNASVADNIRLGNPLASQEDVIEAARNAYAHEFIVDLPDGYHTHIGERGARLSAGQAQRLALARAFLMEAPILILDEATANLDPGTTSKIQAAMQKLITGRTALVIAHRLNTIQNADQIIVIDQGRVAEAGSHEQLLANHGLYWQMLIDDPPTKTIPPPAVAPIKSGKPHISPTPAGDPAHPISFSSLFSLLRQLSPYKWLVLLSVILGWATVASGIGLLATSAYLISAAALQPSIAVLQVPIVGVRFFGLARGIFRYLERYVSHDTTFRLLAKLRVWFYQVLEPLAPARLMQYRSGDLLNRIHQDINSLEEFYVRVVAPPLVWVLVTLTSCALLAVFSTQLALILLAFQLLAGLATPVLIRYASRNAGTRLVSKRSELSAVLVDSIQGMPDLQVFNAARRQEEIVANISRSMAAAQSQLGLLSAFESAAGNVLAHLASWMILFMAIPLIRVGQIEAVYLGTLLLAALASFEAANPLPQAARSLESSLAAANRLEQVIAAQPEVRDPVAPLPVPHDLNLQIMDLRFSYPPLVEADLNQEHSSLALDGINLELPTGKHLAIVGPSGAGKTTLVNILLRFWDYKEGHILFGKEDLSQYRQDEIRALIGVVSQRTYLFNATLRDNLRLARPEASLDEIVRACKAAQIHDFIASLPAGYNTWIGEAGLRLSGGERQRLAIARTLLKDAPMLILDEPTANLDSITERDLVQSLISLAAGRTSLWITHRLLGMESMDEILVMNRGRIVERGDHTQLMDLDGMYRRLWELQHQIV
ncbi:MAG: thiol reductant ABC exporter subunit CydD [Anaerolineales bacterium]